MLLMLVLGGVAVWLVAVAVVVAVCVSVARADHALMSQPAMRRRRRPIRLVA